MPSLRATIMCSLAAAACLAAQAPASAETRVYENGLVWTGAGFERRAFAVSGGRFADPAQLPADSERIDLGGGFVVPPYGNAHAHVTMASEGASWSYLEAGVFYIWNPNTVVLGERALDFFARPDTYDVRLAQGGITEPGGHPEKLYVEELGPRIYQGRGLDWFLGNAFHYGRDMAEIDAALDLLAAQRATFVKSYLLDSQDYGRRRDDPGYYGRKGLNPVNFSYLVTAARKRGLPVAVHVETAHDLRIAALSGAAVAAHLPGYWAVRSEEDLRSRALTEADAALVARSGMLVVPTYAIARFGEEGQAVPRSRVYALQADNVRLLKAAGAHFLIGTDTAGPIFEEVEHLVEIGAFTAPEAVAAALGTGARLFPERRLGCFDPGCEADFLVLEADPTGDAAALRGIRMRVKAGRELRAPESG